MDVCGSFSVKSGYFVGSDKIQNPALSHQANFKGLDLLFMTKESSLRVLSFIGTGTGNNKYYISDEEGLSTPVTTPLI